ncbi:MAG: tetratricopeptide repeat protein, partial [Desulfovibrionales bacterium]|nr:tetratricopeptide repeat protein [Desulfovibrionales bacterium]
MMKKTKNKPNIFFHLMVLVGVLWIFFPSLVAAKLAQLRQIVIKDSPISLRLGVDQKVPVKIIQIDDREILIALRNTRAKKDMSIKGRKVVRDLAVENLDGNVTALVVSTGEKIQRVRSYFDSKNQILRVDFQNRKKALGKPPRIVPKRVKKLRPAPPVSFVPKADLVPAGDTPYPQVLKKAPVKEDVRVAPLPAPKPIKKPPAKKKKIERVLSSSPKTPPEYLPPKRRRTEFKGNLDDIYRVVEKMACDEEQLQEAIHLIKKKSFKEAFERIDYYISLEKYTCLEAAHFLRAYAFYRAVVPGDYVGLMEAQKKFQNALVVFPKSDFIPYGLTATGLIQMSMKNASAAEGYFNVVLQEHPNYVGLPEVEYFLGLIYMDKGYMDKALGVFKRVFESEVDHSYIADAGIGYGKALYEKKQYFNALRIFNYVMKLDVQKIYDSPDLLMCAANSNFELGLHQGAISLYMKAMNLFEELKDKDIILSKVGDAYGMEDRIERAIKVYELVREKYPDTQGYINASMGIARYLKADDEKIQMYTMIKTKFPENTYSRIAMMRLAEIYEKNGEYDRCIKEIEDLLSTHPRGLRYEAVKLMQKAYEELFRDKLDKDAYTQILGRYEQEYVKIDKMGSRKIEFFLGQAYLEAGLWDQSFNHFMNS